MFWRAFDKTVGTKAPGTGRGPYGNSMEKRCAGELLWGSATKAGGPAFDLEF
jgi:hypothetical protein